MSASVLKLDRPLAWCLFGVAALWTALALTSWTGLGAVWVGVPFSNYGIGQPLLFSMAAQTLPIVAGLALEAAAALIGYVLVIRPLWGARSLASPQWLVLAGIVPGTLLVVAVVRLVTMVAPNAVAPAVLMTLIAASALALLVREIRLGLSRPNVSRFRWTSIAGVAIVLLVTLIFQMQFDRFHVLGDGSVWFIDVLKGPEHGVGAQERWPIFGQHYDEATFLYPVVMGLMKPGQDVGVTLTFLYWIMNTVGRAGAFSLIYLAIRALGLDRLSALALLVFLGGASLSLNPVGGRVMFDSLNPLAFVLHEMRIVVAVFPLLIVALAQAMPGKPRLSSLGIAVLLGLGLASTPIHGVMLIAFVAALAILVGLAPGAANGPVLWRASGLVTLLLAGALTLVYAWRGGAAAAHIAILVASAFVAGAIMLWPVVTGFMRKEQAEPSGRLSPALMVATIAGAVVGLLFFGNVFIHALEPALSQVWPWSGVGIIDRLQEEIIPTGLPLARSPYCEGGYSWGHRMISGHCGSAKSFVATYGLAFVAVMMAVGWRLFTPATQFQQPVRQATTLVWAMMLCLLVLPLSFALFDFVAPVEGANDQLKEFSIWARSRLLEPWFYGAVAIAFVLLLREAPARVRRWLQSALFIATAIFLLNPLVLPAQLTANFAYLLNNLVAGVR